MAKISLGGNPINTMGELPKVGESAKNFTLVAADLSEKSLSDFSGKRVVLNIFPSIDIPSRGVLLSESCDIESIFLISHWPTADRHPG